MEAGYRCNRATQVRNMVINGIKMTQFVLVMMSVSVASWVERYVVAGW